MAWVGFTHTRHTQPSNPGQRSTETHMDFTLSETQVYWRDRVVAFMNEHIYPAVPVYAEQMKAFGANRWQVVPILEELKTKARAAGLWNLFLPHDSVPKGSPYAGAAL